MEYKKTQKAVNGTAFLLIFIIRLHYTELSAEILHATKNCKTTI